MIVSTYIGSGDVASLMASVDSKAYLSLLQRFVSDEIPYHNAKESPIDALRTGAILEDRFFLTLDDSWFAQYYVQSNEMDVFKATLDFAQLTDGKVSDFIELKSVNFDDFLNYVVPARDDNDKLLEYLLKKHKAYYYQVQEQLYCTELERARLCFLCVTSYDDDENYQRDIQTKEYAFVDIERDDSVIESIKQRGEIFQKIKNHLNQKK